MLIPPAVALFLLAVPAAAQVAPRQRADAHFLSGFDHRRAGRDADARREWTVCLEIEPAHDFCDFALSTLPAPADESVTAAPPPAEKSPEEREAQQSYLEGVIYYQKGDFDKALTAWRKARQLAPQGSDTAADAAAGLDRLRMLEVPGAGDKEAKPVLPGKTPADLKTGKTEWKDEHEATQSYLTGMIYYQKGDNEKAREAWNRARSLAPANSGVAADIAAALAKLDGKK